MKLFKVQNSLAINSSLKSGQTGITFLELVVVISIIGIISAFALPSFKSIYAKTRLNEGLDEIRKAINTTKSASTSSGSPVSLNIDITNKQLIQYLDKNTAGFDSTDSILKIFTLPIQVSTMYLDSGTVADSKFYPNGSLSQSLYLKVTLSSGKSAAIKAMAATGRLAEYQP